eukprot:TRINITY_DN67938_c0_g1_i1.p1 TRINITY_DN67938_c0_g1~~TRINITY_DN67938_c0_g1_i1.p1  ORF type:complete len:498 (-),score=16.62 TRINITY_DN67938_c0_g1_i1:192-1685(-)
MVNFKRLRLIIIVVFASLIGVTIGLFAWIYNTVFLHACLPMIGGSCLCQLIVYLAYKTAPIPDRKDTLRLVTPIGILYAFLGSLINCVFADVAAGGLDETTDKIPNVFWIVYSTLGLFQLTSFAHMFALSRPTMPSLIYRLVISWPATIHFTGTVLGAFILPGLVVLPRLQVLVPIPALPFFLAGFGFVQSLYDSAWRRIVVQMPHKDAASYPSPLAVKTASFPLKDLPTGGRAAVMQSDPPTLTIVQITDPHLGSFMSIDRLRATCSDIVKIQPDLVLLTGDYFTPEGDCTQHALRTALAPLRALDGRTFACFGNHDIENKRVQQCTEDDLAATGVKLLVNADATLETRIGLVHITSSNFIYANHQEHLATLCQQCPVPSDAALSLFLLHDPKGFQYIPRDRGCITFSGHTHGGQVGFTFGPNAHWSVVKAVAKSPDQGLFRNGDNLLYVHRGTGFRSLSGNMVARVGIPNENSVMWLSPKQKAVDTQVEDAAQEE